MSGEIFLGRSSDEDDTDLATLQQIIPTGRPGVLTARQYLTNSARYNVHDFGAVGNGTTNDAPAIQAAFDAAHLAGRGTVVLKERTYRCDAAITGYSGVNIEGEGIFETRLEFTNDTDGIVLDMPAFATLGVTVSNMTIVGSHDPDTVGIRASSLTQLIVRRVQVSGFGVNMRGRDFIFTHLEDCQFLGYYGTQGCVVFGDETPVGTFATTLFISDTYISAGDASTACCLAVDRTTTFIMRGGAVESGGVGLKVGATNDGTDGLYTSNVLIEGVDFENCVGGYIEVGTAWTAPGYAVRGIELRNIFTFTSGSTNTPIGYTIANANDIRIKGHAVYLTNPGTVGIDFVGTNNTMVDVGPASVFDLQGGDYIRSNGVVLPHEATDSIKFLPGEGRRLTIDHATIGAISGFAGFNTLRLDSIANNAEVTLPTFTGRVYVFTNNGVTAEFELQGGNNVSNLISDPSGTTSDTYNTGSKINVAWNGASAYKLQNKSGFTQVIRVILIGAP